MNEQPDPFREWDSAYVLGMLSVQERATFERHLATCPDCSAAVAQLAGLPGILSALSADEATRLDTAADDSHLREAQHQPGLLQKLATSADRRRRRVRTAMFGTAIAVAAVFAVGGVAVGANLPAAVPSASHAIASPPEGPVIAMAQVTPDSMTAQLQVSARKWGTLLNWSCQYRDDASTAAWSSPTYNLVVTDKSGNQTIVATWTAVGSKAKGLTASTSVPTANIGSVEIQAATTGTPLVRATL